MILYRNAKKCISKGGKSMNYEISKGTLAILPNTNNSSLVYEDDERFLIDTTPFKIMEESCKYFGSTFQGRLEGSKEILGAEYKVPIVIEDSNNIIVFPTTSPVSSDCGWIVLNRIKNFHKIESNRTKIVFDNEKEIIVPVSYRTIENQVSRAARLDMIIRNRILN